jgi:predicted RNase H-like HicB family nuclease
VRFSFFGSGLSGLGFNWINSIWQAAMKTYTAVVERCPDTHLYVGYIPGFPGAHSQGETLDELKRNLQEVIELLLTKSVGRSYIRWAIT